MFINANKNSILKRIIASTLVEVIIAMVVLMVVFGITLQIFMNIEGYNGNREKLYAYMLTNTLLNKTTLDESFEDMEFEKGHLIIQQSIDYIDSENGIIQIEIIAKNRHTNHTLITRKEIINTNQ